MNYQQWDVDAVGILVGEEYARARLGKQSIYINKQNAAQFMVRPISEMPSNFPNISVFTGYPSDIETFGFEDVLSLENEPRQQAVREFFSEYLIIFNPVQKWEHSGITNVRLAPKPPGYTEATTYVPVPVFSQAGHSLTYDQFILSLQQNYYVGKIPGISTDPSDTPSLVLWKESEDKYFVVGEFERHRYAHGGFLFGYQSLKSIPFQEAWFNDLVIENHNPMVSFIGNETYQLILQALGNAPKIEAIQDPIIEIVSADNSNLEEEQSEIAFLNDFIQLTLESGFAYDPKDLINFHTAMKTSNLVILAGMSGTGKSQLVQLYGRALGMDDTQLTMIPVSPSWTDDADLIGYVDSIHMVYRPGDSGLVKTLMRANKEQAEHLFIVCFDEMNLARVEHYFSQFLSVLEMEASKRKLKLYNEEVQPRLYNGDEYLPSVTLGDNVIFVGTVNLDESTYHFSDKVLDRANVINLNVRDFADLKGLSNKRTRRKEMPFYAYRNFRQQEETFDLPQRELDFLTALNQALIESGLGFGPRVVRQIARYMANLPIGTILHREKAFDLQIIQRVLTKVRGPEDQLKILLGRPNARTGQIENGTVYEVLSAFSDVSLFESTYKILLKKAKELKLYGYTL